MTLLLTVLGCATRVPALASAFDDAPETRWSPDGRAVVDERRVVDPDTGEAAGLAGAEASFSPSGARIVWVDHGLLHWGQTGGVSHLVDMARWIGDGSDPPTVVVAWLDEERVYVHQLDPSLVYEARTTGEVGEACRVYHVRDGTWSEPQACMRGDMALLYAVSVRDGLAIVGSHGEGHPALDVVAWTPEGSAAVGFPSLDLYPFGPVDATHRGEGAIDLLTPCRLEDAQRPCQRPDGEDRTDEPWRHYRWGRDGAIELVRDELPRRTTVDPTGDRYLWPTESGWCVGDPARRGAFACVEEAR